MNIRTIMLVFLVALGMCAAANAATEQWRSASVPFIFQIVADGSGGCAFAFTNGNGTASVAWLDKKGATIHQGDVSKAMLSPIIRCTSKELLYATGTTFVSVDNKGTATTITASSGVLQPDFLGILPMSVTADAKGFFGVLFNIGDDKQALIRFKNK